MITCQRSQTWRCLRSPNASCFIFCDLWSLSVTFSICQGHFHFNHLNYLKLAPTFAVLIPARRFTPSGFALSFLVASHPQDLCFAFAFSVASLPRALYFVLASTLALGAYLRRCATLHHHHLKKKKPDRDRNRTCTHVLIKSVVQHLNHTATGEAL